MIPDYAGGSNIEVVCRRAVTVTFTPAIRAAPQYTPNACIDTQGDGHCDTLPF